MNLVTLLEERARSDPDRISLVEGRGDRRRSLTFAELADRAGAGSDRLADAGIRPGDVILFLHPVSIDLYVAMLAVMRVGAVAMFVDPGAGLRGIRLALQRIAPAAWLGRGKGRLARWMIPGLWLLPEVRPQAASPGGHGQTGGVVETAPDAPALITFTSGSTGTPKAAERSHSFLLEQNRVLGRSFALCQGEIDLVTLPIFALANLAHGVTSVLADTDLARPGSANAAAIEDQIQAESITRAAAAPAFFERLLAGGVSLRSMKKIFTGGGPVFPSLMQRLARQAPAARVAAVYGSTEAEPIAHVDAAEFAGEDLEAMKTGAGLLAGRPVEEIRLAIIPDRWGRPIEPMSEAAFDTLRRRPGEAGEIVVSGLHVLGGYLDGIGDEETKFRVGGHAWHRTGDAGRLDAAGRVWLLGRCGAIIRDERGVLFPFAVETALSFQPAVRRSAICLSRGKRILVVETSTDFDQSAADGLGIDEVVQVEAIPVDSRHQSKVLYPELLRLVDRVAPRSGECR